MNLCLIVSGGLAAIVDLAQGLDVDGERMKQNLDQTRGLIMAEAVSFALAGKIGKADAHALIEEASRKSAAGKRHLKDVLLEDARVNAHLSEGDLLKLFEPTGYQGVAQVFIERQVAPLQRNSKRS
jgi:3-carboxy-cis,cis-muconate cycloisomerase